jgi:hypothetical protein
MITPEITPTGVASPPLKEFPAAKGDFFIIAFGRPSFCTELASWRIGMVSDNQRYGRMQL